MCFLQHLKHRRRWFLCSEDNISKSNKWSICFARNNLLLSPTVLEMHSVWLCVFLISAANLQKKVFPVNTCMNIGFREFIDSTSYITLKECKLKIVVYIEFEGEWHLFLGNHRNQFWRVNELMYVHIYKPFFAPSDTLNFFCVSPIHISSSLFLLILNYIKLFCYLLTGMIWWKAIVYELIESAITYFKIYCFLVLK